MIYVSNGPSATEDVGAALAKRLQSAGKKRAFIALFGEMGVGKTAFVRGFCRELGILRVKSPTYTIINEYRGTCVVYHLDVYRLVGPEDLEGIGFDDYLTKDAYILTEWTERIEEVVPPDAVRVKIERTGEEDGRRVSIEGDDWI